MYVYKCLGCCVEKKEKCCLQCACGNRSHDWNIHKKTNINEQYHHQQPMQHNTTGATGWCTRKYFIKCTFLPRICPPLYKVISEASGYTFSFIVFTENYNMNRFKTTFIFFSIFLTTFRHRTFQSKTKQKNMVKNWRKKSEHPFPTIVIAWKLASREGDLRRWMTAKKH